MNKYNHKKIEAKWQKYWIAKKTFLAKDFSKKTKKFVLVEFPYPSGEGLHMGHLRPYVAGDVYARYQRLQGHETVFPMGWDAFGLPAENYAIKKGVHPSISTKKNVANAKKQINSWGLSFDWSREINTTDPAYYKWTQWIFLQLFKKGLAYEATGLINWCPKDKTGLANEEVIDGACERCGTKVEKKELRQWYLKITAYAEKLLSGLKTLDKWPEAVKLQQENWIGKSVGAEINFVLAQPPVKRFVILHGKGGSPKENFIPWLKAQLEKKGFEVQAPQLPNASEPDDVEQTEFVKNNCTFDNQTVIIGHSFGGIVAIRLLEQGIKVNRTILISTPFSGKFLDGKTRVSVTTACKKGFDFEKIKKNNACFSLLYDTSDYVVPISDGEEFEKGTGFGLLKAKGQQPHFSAKEEPEVLDVALGNLKVFTTRPDTIFGATYLVLSPEHPLAWAIGRHVSNRQEILKYIEAAKSKSDIDRSAEGKEKTGVELKGAMAINPASKQQIPIWIADYVLAGYGTGAIMAVPAHDRRDFEFAKKFNLDIKPVIAPKDPQMWNVFMPGAPGGMPDKSDPKYGFIVSRISEQFKETPYTLEGILINSGEFDGMKTGEVIQKMANEFGKVTTEYKLRDWVFSRQRYWGEPIPIIHCPKCGIVPVPEKDLPVKLPPVKKYEPTGTGESPLAVIDKWVNVKCPNCKSPAKRETNTMPQWAGSSWYWLRYTDPRNKKSFADIKKQKYWTPVDVYFGGMEHTTLHLLYSRFWNLFLFDQGLVTASEPYTLRKPHGIILAADGEKMSKSRGNVVNPDEIVKSHGADTLRMYELFLGPHEMAVSWNDQGIVGVRRFLDRVWFWGSNKKDQNLESDKAKRALHRLIKKVTEDVEAFKFNTCVSAFMEFFNEIKDEPLSAQYKKTFLTLLYSFAPHISEELYQLLGGKKSLQLESWPEFDPALVIDQTIEMIIQVNGKVKGRLTLQRGIDQATVQAKALELAAVKQAAAVGVKRTIFIPNKLINLVV